MDGIQWIKDNIINDFIQLISHETIHKLMESYYILHATKFKQKAFLSYERIYQPINDDNRHWFTIVINNIKKEIQLVDSNKSRSSARKHKNKYFKRFKQRMHKLHEEDVFVSHENNNNNNNQYLNRDGFVSDENISKLINSYKWTVRECPQQSNGSDCGMFVMKFIQFDSQDIPLSYSQKDMAFFREKSKAELLKKEIIKL